MSAPKEVPQNIQLARKPFHAPDHRDSISTSESEESVSMSTTPPIGRHNPRRKSTLRGKVSKLKRSTQSLFRKTPKVDSDVNETPSKPDIIRDEFMKHHDVRLVPPTVSDTAGVPTLHCEVLENPVAECPIMASIIPLPESVSEELLVMSPRDSISTDGHSDLKSSEPEVTRTSTLELAELYAEPTEPEPEPTRDALQTSTENATPKAVIDTTLPPPVSSQTSPYVFGRFTYYQVSAFTLAAIGICVVVVPQTYRLLRLR